MYLSLSSFSLYIDSRVGLLFTRKSTDSHDEAKYAAHKLPGCRLATKTSSIVTHVVLCGQNFTGKTFKALWGIANGNENIEN